MISLNELSVELNSAYENDQNDDNLSNVPIPEGLMEIKHTYKKFFIFFNLNYGSTFVTRKFKDHNTYSFCSKLLQKAYVLLLDYVLLRTIY